MDAFLDTTAVVDLLFKDSTTKLNLTTLLEPYDVKYSSQYVRMEIKRGVLRHFVYLHNKAVECESFAEVQASIHALSSSLQRNKLGTILEALKGFWSKFESVQLTDIGPHKPADFAKSMLAAYLRVRIKRFWKAFERLVDVVLDGPECYKNFYQLKPPTFDGRIFDNTLANCDKFKPGICIINDFFASNNITLKVIHQNISAISKPDNETQKRRSAIKDVFRVPKRQVLQKDCWHMGDAIILLEAPTGSAIINGNCKHYDPMCVGSGRTSVCYHKSVKSTGQSP